MGQPCINLVETVSGVTFYRDSIDPDTWHYGMAKAPWLFSRRPIGNQKIIWNARRELTPSAQVFDAFKQRHANAKLLPIAATSGEGDIASRIQISAPHTANVQVVPSMPFATILFSATLDAQDASCGQLDAAIQTAIQNDNLLGGAYSVTFDALRLEFAAKIKIDLRQQAQRIALATKPFVYADEFHALLASDITNNLASFISIDCGVITPEQNQRIKTYIHETSQSGLSASETQERAFDQGILITKIRLREPLELRSEPLTNSISVSQMSREVLTLGF
jgi:hypothetical protein